MDSGIPLLSIIIPTRNRFDYVRFAIESVLKIASNKFELVIQDNSDSNELEAWIKSRFNDSRLVYAHSNLPVSMCENYEGAAELASGEYLCFIGDDDGVNPEIIDATIWTKQHHFDALIPSSVINYVWPDLKMESRASMKSGELSIRTFTGELTIPSAEIELLKSIKSASQNFYKLPKAYYGIVKKSCFDIIKKETGLYFPGVSPDMSAATSLALTVGQICHVDYPLFVPGSSLKSNAGLAGLKKHVGRLIDQPHLPNSCEDDWSYIVPKFYSIQTIWAESAVNSLTAMNRFDILRKFNIPLLYALCCVFHIRYMPSSIRRFYRALNFCQQNSALGTIKFFYWFSYWWCLRLKSLVFRFFGGSYAENSYRKSGLNSIDEAVQAASQFLASSKITFKSTFQDMPS